VTGREADGAAARVPIDWVWLDRASGRYLMWNAASAPAEPGPMVALTALDGRVISLPRRLLVAHELPVTVVSRVLALAIEEALERAGEAVGGLVAVDPAAPPRDVEALHAEAGGEVSVIVERLFSRLAQRPNSAPDPLAAIDDVFRTVSAAIAFGPAAEPLAARLGGLLAQAGSSRGFDEAEADALSRRVATEVADDLARRLAERPLIDLSTLFDPPAGSATEPPIDFVAEGLDGDADG
jgi:hypothetical protein